ncbi:MAG: phage Gp37/Gp68 family protein [Phycisphaeraceae bacterium]
MDRRHLEPRRAAGLPASRKRKGAAMSTASKIEWTDATWNPIVGCSIVSPGCTHCYAMRDAWRKHHNPAIPHYRDLTKSVNGNAVWTGKLALAPDHILTAPLHWKKPRRIFVNSMGDLFHEDAPDEWIDKVFAVMALCPQHQFQVLTKRAERMRAHMTAEHPAPNVKAWQARVCAAIDDLVPERTNASRAARDRVLKGPLDNVWKGVSAERQQEADARIPHLLQTPAAIRFVSAEPLLGAIDLTSIADNSEEDEFTRINALNGDEGICLKRIGGPRLDWIIVGGESGPNARPMRPVWARSLRDQCDAADVPFFFKQWGAWAPCDVFDPPHGDSHHVVMDGQWFARVGKDAAGRLLDGREWNGWPIARADAPVSGAAD